MKTTMGVSGHFNQIINFNAKKFDIENQDFTKSKCLEAYYKIGFRFKSSLKSTSKNSEQLSLNFDENRSSDFIKSYLNFENGESLTVVLIKSEQPEFGNTALTLEVQYVNPAQELFKNREVMYCETLPGTIEKRLQSYKECFDLEAEHLIENFKKHGFKVKDEHVIYALALHILHNFEVNDQVEKSFVNAVLNILSIHNNDILQPENINPYEKDLIFNGDIENIYYKARVPFDDVYTQQINKVSQILSDELKRLKSANSPLKDLIYNASALGYEEFKKQYLQIYKI